MSAYRKKPVVIEARQLSSEDSLFDILDWIDGHGAEAFGVGEDIHIVTLEGTMVASKGDYVIRGVQGEFYPCKPDIFAATYMEIFAAAYDPLVGK